MKVKYRTAVNCAVLISNKCRQSQWELTTILGSLATSNNSCFQIKITTQCLTKLKCREKVWKISTCRSMIQTNFQVFQFKFISHSGGLRKRIKIRTKIWWNLNKNQTTLTRSWCYKEKVSLSSIQDITKIIRLLACNLSLIWITWMNLKSWTICSVANSAI